MNTRKTVFHIFSLLFVLVFVLAQAPMQPVRAGPDRRWYVSPAGADVGKTCTNWTDDACSLTYALGLANLDDQVWALEGTYTPQKQLPTDPARSESFHLLQNVAIYGGFTGSETSLDQRRLSFLHQSILSGDLPGGARAYHVVTGAPQNIRPGILDGFTITRGLADGTDPDDRGAGLINGLYLKNDPHLPVFNSPVLRNVTFIDNQAAADGGGMYTAGDTESDPPLLNYPTFTNVAFINNSAGNNGGGLYVADGSSPKLTNVTFSGNTADNDGGGIYNKSTTGFGTALFNTTFVANNAGHSGGGVDNDLGIMAIHNSIFWANTTDDTGAQIYNFYEVGVTQNIPIEYSIVQDGCPDLTNPTYCSDADPLLSPLADNGGYNQTYSIPRGSPAFNTANSDQPAVCPYTDQRGIPRLTDPGCDIGAFEAEIHAHIMAVPSGGLTSGWCESWANACDLQYALSNAYHNQTIWAQSGIYTPSLLTNPSDPHSATFQLREGVTIAGGYYSTNDPPDRDIVLHPSILSGDFGGSVHAYHVVTGSGMPASAVLDGVTVSAGRANGSADLGHGAGMFISDGSPTLKNVTFSANLALLGGGMYTTGNSQPALTGVTFDNNTAQQGGGMYNNTSGPLLTDVTFKDNIATEGVNSSGGGMYNLLVSGLVMTGGAFTGNHADYSGGGMKNDQSGTSSMTLDGVDFHANSAVVGGGMANQGSSPTLTNVTFSDNTAQYGGGMYNKQSSPDMIGGSFTNNTANNSGSGRGGGMYNEYNDAPSLTNVTFSGNHTDGWGGGMMAFSSSPTLTGVAFINNTAGSDGGGMNSKIASTPIVTSTILDGVTFSGNTSGGNGGGYYNLNYANGSNISLVSLENVTFNSNSADASGGAFYNDSGDTTLTNLTFSANSAVTSGGAIYDTNAAYPGLEHSLQVRNSILWGDTAGSSQEIDATTTTPPAVSHSIVQGGYTGDTVLTLDPKLGPFGTYGGFTSTFPLLEGSPAINSASPAPVCPGHDQRGVVRPQGAGCDMGAYEFDVSADPIPPQLYFITAADPNPSHAASVNFTVTFSEPVTGVDASDFQFSAVGKAFSGYSITGITDGPVAYTVSVNTGSGNGTLRLDLKSGTNIQDLAGNHLIGGFTGGVTYIISKTAPVPLLPLDGAQIHNYRPTFTWADAENGIGFQIQISTSSSFKSTLISKSLTTTTFTPPKSLATMTKMYWRVRAKLTATKYSAWSDVRMFTVLNPPKTPILVSPGNGASVTGYLPRLDWKDAVGAATYLVQVSKSSSFKGPVVNLNVTVSEYTLTTPLAPKTTWYWRVRANNDAQISAWSSTRTFKTK